MFDSLFWQQLWNSFHFIRPFWLLALLPFAMIVRFRWKQEADAQWQQILPKHLRDVLTIGDKGWKRQLPLKALTILMALGIVVCAGPTWQREASPFGEDKSEMLIVLDASESMLATDLAPNRLERGKQKIRDLLQLRQGGKTGLAVFSGSAHISMPPTEDTAVFTPFLAAIEPTIMPIAGKAAEKVLPLISSQLTTDQAGSVLLITDGANPATINAFEQYFSNSHHQLLILAVGNSGVNSSSPLDLKALQTLSNKTGGKLVQVSIDNSDVDTLNRYVERHMQLNNESAMPWKDMGYYLLLPILIILLLWFRRGWLVQWCLVAAVILPTMYTPSVMAETVHVTAVQSAEPEKITFYDRAEQWWMNLWLTADQQGQYYFNQQNYLKAAQHYSDPLYKGVAYYYAAEYKLAHTAFLQVGSELGFFNAANALARQREYLAARDVYQDLSQNAQSDEIRQHSEQNYQVLQGIVDEINRVSESQSGTTDGPEESFELGDRPRTADGADEEVSASMMVRETLNANEILGSEELADKWLRRVEADPKYFLRAKFQLQLLDRVSQPVTANAGEHNE
ncbi:VWA domain-containing protein [Photobacterium minamisatsumaniensis]|uniref:VWA domain-containing protein n=1 Tax=Photobacterium minamisatsumaniensis TaxID=2910233 RepID=UPI003D0E59D6